MKLFEKIEEKIIEVLNKIQESTISIEFQRYITNFDLKLQRIILYSATILLALIFLSPILLLNYSVKSKKEVIKDLRELTDYLAQSSTEISQLQKIIKKRGRSTERSIKPNASIREIAESSLQNAHIIADRYEIQQSSNDSLSIDMELISLPQLVKILYDIEKNHVEIQELNIDTKNNQKGYIWARINSKKENTNKFMR